MISKKEKGIELIDEILSDIDNPKVSLLSSINKLNRASKLLNEKEILVWTEIQLGITTYTLPLINWVEIYLDKNKTKENEKKLKALDDELNELGIKLGKTIDGDELTAKARESGGGFKNIGFIEERYADITKFKKGNDGTYYQSNLLNTLTIVKSLTFKKASALHSKYAFESLPQTNFEFLKNRVEDVLFDLDPELAEMLMLAFKAVSSDSEEEWSQALTTCRRFLESLADKLFPPTEELIHGRKLNKENYINRIWAFMDLSIKSQSNKELAKRHVDLLGNYIQSNFKITNKGVHTKINRIEAVKTVFHIYMACVDLLGYLDKGHRNNKPNLNVASMDEIEAFGGVSRNIAKEIIKCRVKEGKLTEKLITQIPGIGEKTIKKLLENMTID
ncbi:helix-hairpin-helix domain-containing protein [Maribellus comscasis]|uniref:Helix-hairpin-helix domain-containing protein n=1 Tax=Maribellus comscasis TaxID=2681766 RepID=A0A6I6K560_9BACT|nr:helix-hairpin-helix domain-containing protein [Maribellus comscasis]QGY47847.1 helix-hairpin-helix domain-containing protein [Maribellus comscasis]